MNKSVRVALLGCGTVGTEVVRLMAEAGDEYAHRIGAKLELVGIAVSDSERERDAIVDRSLLTTDAESLLERADIVIELIGGIEPPRALVTRALSLGKTVVTGNKALLATHGPQLWDAAAKGGADLYFEAAVAGAIPVVYGLRESLVGDRIQRVSGIVNGTTNFMLDMMNTNGCSYEEALQQAQELGYAEADPTADVDGLDAAAKCAILASLAFHTRVGIEDVDTSGIRSITPADHAQAAAQNQVIKLLAIAEQVTDENGKPAVSARVHATVIPNSNPLAAVGGPFNAVLIDAAAAGPLMFYGQGAGGAPTASAVMSDVVAAASHVAWGGTAPRESTYAHLPVLPAAQHRSAYRLRLRVADEVGVLAHITGVVAEHNVSIRAVAQSCAAEDSAELTISTHTASAADINSLVTALSEDATVSTVVQVLHVEEEQ